MPPSSRASVASSSQHSSKARSQKGGEDDFPPIESDETLVTTINELPLGTGQKFTLNDLRNPKPQQIQRIYEVVIEVIMNMTRDMVAPVMKAAAEDIHGVDPETERVFPPDTRDQMAFFVLLRKVMKESFVVDFKLADMHRPTYKRLVVIFSYIANFIRFREKVTAQIDEHINSTDEIRRRVEAMYEQKRDKEQDLADKQDNRKNVEEAMAAKQEEKDTLLRKLRAVADDMNDTRKRLEVAKAEKSRLKSLRQERRQKAEMVQSEADKLKPYTEQSPSALDAELKALEASLKEGEDKIARMERRSRALQTSLETIVGLQAEVADLATLLGDLQAEIKREDETTSQTNRNKDLISERSLKINEVEAEESRLRNEVQIWQQRTESLRQTAKEKADETQAKMEELKSSHRKLAAERRDKGDDIEMARMRIEGTEKRMNDLKAEMDHEVQTARQQYNEMEAHITRYMTDMSQVMIS